MARAKTFLCPHGDLKKLFAVNFSASVRRAVRQELQTALRRRLSTARAWRPRISGPPETLHHVGSLSWPFSINQKLPFGSTRRVALAVLQRPPAVPGRKRDFGMDLLHPIPNVRCAPQQFVYFQNFRKDRERLSRQRTTVDDFVPCAGCHLVGFARDRKAGAGNTLLALGAPRSCRAIRSQVRSPEVGKPIGMSTAIRVEKGREC